MYYIYILYDIKIYLSLLHIIFEDNFNYTILIH